MVMCSEKAKGMLPDEIGCNFAGDTVESEWVAESAVSSLEIGPPLVCDECECDDEEPEGGGFSAPKRRILVMDDEQMLQRLLEQMLDRLGYEAAVTGCGEEALLAYFNARKSGRPFDAVILDLTVQGGMGGKETLQALREMDRSIKAIVSSGYAGDPVMADCLNWGFCAVIPKPYRMRDLGRILDEVFSNG
jgi:two-component system, cell cycle sensor histidine kinase and response regulator CckA